MQPFKEDFGTCKLKPTAAGVMTKTCSLTALQQSLVSVTFLFVALGGSLSGLTGNYLGRRGTIQVGCIFVAAGAGGMLGTSGNYAAYIACKCLGGVGLGLFMAGVPAYGVECTSASKRGMLTSLFSIGFGVGNAMAAVVCLCTSKYTSSLAWKTPIICQLPMALLLGVGVMMFPESPRWLLTKGKDEAARKSFARFYAAEPSDLVVSRQVQEVLHYIELERAMGSTTSWTEIFHSDDRRRTFTSLLVVIGQAISGGKFISTYAAVFLSAVGISSPFVITVTVASCAVIGGLISPFIVEYIGRRFSLLVGYTTMAVFMLVISAVATGLGSTNSTAKTVLVVLLCLWTVIYGGFIGTSTSTIAPEMHSVRLRTYGQAVAAMVYEIFSFGSAFYTPYMLSAQYGNMGTNVGYFYFGEFIVPFLFHVLTCYRCNLGNLDYGLCMGSRDRASHP